MKKITILMAAIALVCFSVPAMAVDWNFYGSARINTWYVTTDTGDGLNAAGTDDKDSEVRWGFNGQTNSRLGARVKADHIAGRVEIQLKGTADGDPGTTVTTESRIIYGEWNFGAGKLKVGKDYSPVSQFISGQVFDEDLGLLGIGTAYANRPNGMWLTFGGFEVALLNPVQNDISNAAGTATGGDVDSYIPKIEAKWGMAFDAFNFNIMGGYQYYSIEDVVTATGTDDVGVTSYIIGGDAGFNFGPAYVKGAVSWTRNGGAAKWNLDGAYTDGAPAVWDGSDGTDDTDTLMGAVAVGMKVSDMLSFEGGFGYRQDDTDANNFKKDKAWSAYVQSVVVLAPGVYVVPEIGYFDFMDDSAGFDSGKAWYAGAKWQIDF